MQLQGFRYTNEGVSLVFVQTILDCQFDYNYKNHCYSLLADKTPNADIEEIKYEEDIWLGNDDILIVQASVSSPAKIKLLEGWADASTAQRKILLCPHRRGFTKLNGFDAVLTADRYGLHDISWAIVSSLFLSILPSDLADLDTVFLSSTKGKLITHHLTKADLRNNLNHADYWQSRQKQRAKIKGLFVAMTLPPKINCMDFTTAYATENTKSLSKDISLILAATNIEESREKFPEIIEIVMSS